MPRLGVNIDHVATIRQARRTIEPDPVWAAALAELAGADGITLHLREDRRHIQDRDLRLLKETVQVKLNLEMAATDAITEIAIDVHPQQCTLVPEKREEVTTEGGLDVIGNKDRVKRSVDRLLEAGIEVSLFIDPDPRQIEASRKLGRRPSNCIPAATPMRQTKPSKTANTCSSSPRAVRRSSTAWCCTWATASPIAM